jgi:hypothetical protein
VNFAIEVASSSMVDIENVIKIGSGFQKFYKGDTDIDAQTAR